METLDRRTFLRSSAVTGLGLTIGFALPRRAEALLAGAGPAKPLPSPDAFLRIGADDSVTVLLAHSEMGQGIWTTLPLLIAEELGCDWSRIRVEHAPAAPPYAHTVFGLQMTGGSTTTWSEFDRYRTVGAMARELLVRAAAADWKVRPASLRVKDGVVTDGHRSARFGELAERARALPPPRAVRLKPASEWTLIGKPRRRLDGPEKITGRAVFGLDVRIPEMRIALVARAPAFGATLVSFRADAAKAVPGVEQVVRVPSGVAVVARNTWAAKRGRDALELTWEGPREPVDSNALLEDFRTRARTTGAVAETAGDVEAALKGAARRLELEYAVPYLAHAPMEPLNCTVRISPDACEIWTGTQFQTPDQAAAAKLLGLRPEQVTIHTTFLGGGFGRRANPASDFVLEAVEVARAAGVPVQTVWTREDDVRGGYYRPAYVHRVELGLDAGGRPVAWKHGIVGQSILAGTPFESMMVKGGVDATSVEGVTESPYLAAVPARLVHLHSPRLPVTVLWWRSVGNSHTAFAMESALDEAAAAAGKDPLRYRLDLLGKHPRHARVLETAARQAGWGTPPAAGRARGLALHESFGSILAQVAEVSIEEGRSIRVHRVTCALDCGVVVNPLGVEAQVQGAIAFGLGAALYSRLTLDKGRVRESNFHDYRVLRMSEMPAVDVHVVPSRAKMGGIGEPGTAPVAAAVANAVFALTGTRLRTLPLRLPEVA